MSASAIAQPPFLLGSPLTDWPHYTQIPNVFIDEHMALLDNPELRVLLYIARRTFGFSRAKDDIPIQQIATGLIRDGQRLDNGTGLDVRRVQRALKSLIDKGLIRRDLRRDASNHPIPSSYSIVFGNPGEIDGGTGTTSKISQRGAHGGTGATSNSPFSAVDGGTGTTTYKEIKPGEEERKEEIPPTPITESEKTEDEQAEQGSVDVEMPVYGENAAAAVRRALDREKRYKLTAKEKRDLAEFAGYGAMYVSAIDRVVPEFVAWAKGYAPAKSATVILHESFSWLDRMREPPEAGLDVDSIVARIERRMNGASNEMSRALDKLLPRQFPRAATPPSSGLPPLAERWNTTVTAGPKVEAWASRGKDQDNLKVALDDLGFTKSLDKTLQWCQNVWQMGHSKRDYVTFSWLIKPGVWAEILNGKHDYLLRLENIKQSVVSSPQSAVDPDFRMDR